ncbi:MAG TPA: carboxypeptidase regulatory-like domain-containing protein, partial [Gemmatimonadaceae bacterium]|nr:carboxypeptidase regulatory-like domain-containing protein [Gemmatimonadaceae bacterium]
RSVMTSTQRFFALFALLTVSTSAEAQSPDSISIVRGTVRASQGAPLLGADVFLLETLDGATTDSLGRFAIRTAHRDSATIVARRIGFAPARLQVIVADPKPILIALERQASALTPITVTAGAYTAGSERGASLNAIQVASTPGATADIARAIQTLPGVQNVDEGTGLFVRGGDVSETRVILNDVVMIAPYNYETPTGNYTVTVNPFLLDGIFFSSGGFGARYGNILSGVADLRTQGRPAQTSVVATAGLAAVSAGLNFALPKMTGLRATGTLSDTRPLFEVNGSTRSYSPAPHGTDVSASTAWKYRPTAEVKTFGIVRHSALGIEPSDPSASGGYAADVRNSMYQAGWKDLFGPLATTVSTSSAQTRRVEDFGGFTLGDTERSTQLFGQAAWTSSERMIIRLGGDAEWRSASFAGRVPSAGVTKFDSKSSGARNGAFVESDLRALTALRIVTGLRSDRSAYTGVRTFDPRVSAALKVGEAAIITSAWGIYHQVPDPLYFDEALGLPGLRPMSARQLVLGAQLGEEQQIARIEVYQKRYEDLAQLTQDKFVVGGGTGRSRGADLFLKGAIQGVISGRLSYSYVDAQRTDPASGLMSRAPFDVTHSVTLVAEKNFGAGWSTSGAFRYATGKPYTAVNGATFNTAQNRWIPSYGAPFAKRMSPLERIDLSVSRFTPLGAQSYLVVFASVNNLFNRVNIYEYRYNEDYTQRIPVRSLFNRSFYVGGSISFARQ